MDEIKNENMNIKEKLEEIMKIIQNHNNPEINYIGYKDIDNMSTIIKPNEFEIINSAIKIRLNKNIKNIKKLYQATIDGGEPLNFHKKCDNINNTLVLIKTTNKIWWIYF